jgi:hypothetical protein
VLSVIFATNFEGFPDMRGMSGFHPCERVPLDWARTQNNLGNAQALLDERPGEMHTKLVIFCSAPTRRMAGFQLVSERHTSARPALEELAGQAFDDHRRSAALEGAGLALFGEGAGGFLEVLR